ncbi:MAG: hypothetical protein AAB263_19585, partial [Planctomycetota bacterium]
GFEDLSNTGYAIQALRASGMPADAPQLKAAMSFLQRCQDLSSVNQQAWVGKSPVQGGAVYGPQEATRSWERGDDVAASRTIPTGSMTYQLLSSYLTLDLKADDPRVTAALGWVTANYGFDQNPGMGVGREQQGLFHAYALASTTFDLLHSTTLTLPDQRQVDWRADLWKAINSRSQEAKLPGGKTGAYWINDAQRWQEGTPILCTAYAIRGMKAILRNLPP